MKWFVVLAVLVGYGEGGALKCLSAEQGSPCRKNLSEKKSPIQIAQDKPAQSSRPAQSALPDCEPGSEWISNCHSCKCSQDGVAKCERMAQCDKAYGEPIRCKPGTHVERDCNHCTCLDNGMLRCTLLFCDNLPILKPSEGKECKPGTNFKSECNDCTCGENGIAACTQVACPKEGNESPKRCAPGSRWSDDCNNCWCTKNGDPICTQRTCIKEPEVEAKSNSSKNIDVPSINRKPYKTKNRINAKLYDRENVYEYSTEINVNLEVDDPTFEDNFEDYKMKEHVFNHIEQDQNYHVLNIESGKDEHNVLKRSVCKPGQDFQTDCNQCKCAPDGQSYTCTQNECMDGNKDVNRDTEVDKEVEVFMENEGQDHVEKHSVCKARGTFYIGCNTCHCNPYGTDYYCSNKPCPLPEDVEIFHELKDMKPIVPYREKESLNHIASLKSKNTPRL